MGVIIDPVEQGVLLGEIKSTKLNTLTVLLIKADLAPLPSTTLADLTAAEANFTGYARKTAQTMSGPVTEPDGNPVLISPNWVFIATDGVTPNTIYGYAVVDAAVAELFYWEKFDAPVPIGAANDAVSFVSRFNMPTPTSTVVPTE